MTAIMLPTTGDITAQQTDHEAIAAYLAGLAPTGRRAVIASLKRVADAVGVAVECMPWATLRATHLEAIKSKLVAQFAPATVNHCLASVRGVLRALWLADRIDAATYQKTAAVKSVRGTRLTAGRDIAGAEIEALMIGIDRTTPAGARDRAIVAVMVVGGLRLDEVAGLTLANYDAASGRLEVIGKGNKQRAVFVGAARYAVGDWLAIRGTDAGALFCPVNKAGRIVSVDRMTAQSVYNMLNRRREAVGLASFSPHDFRRTAIGNMLSAGVDIATIARHVGHASVTTTARYDRRPEAQQRAAVERIAIPGL